MNVFVLCTGRCGSMTFVAASKHLTNYTAGHETKASRIGPKRFDFPDNHIEVDNRLSWQLGGLGKRYDGSDVLYVHLKRDPEAVALSYLRRWNSPFRASIIRAFGHGITMRVKDWPEESRIEVSRHYVRTVTDNIEDFLRDRPSMSVDLERATTDYAEFLDRIGAEGDRAAALAEWGTKHNASKNRGAAAGTQ